MADEQGIKKFFEFPFPEIQKSMEELFEREEKLSVFLTDEQIAEFADTALDIAIETTVSNHEFVCAALDKAYDLLCQGKAYEFVLSELNKQGDSTQWQL